MCRGIAQCVGAGLRTYMHIGLLVACGGSVGSGLWHRLNGIGMRCMWMAQAWVWRVCGWRACGLWATRVGGAAAGSMRLRSARLAAVVLRKGRKCMHRVVAWA